MKAFALILSLSGTLLMLLPGSGADAAQRFTGSLGSSDPGAILNQQLRDWQILQREPWRNRALCASDYLPPKTDDLIQYDDAMAERLNIPKATPWEPRTPQCQPHSQVQPLQVADSLTIQPVKVLDVKVQPVKVQDVKPLQINVQPVKPETVKVTSQTVQKVSPLQIQILPVNIQPVKIPTK